MCNWRACLLPGLLTLVLLTAIAVLVRGGPIEADLTARSLAMLEADGTPWASASLDGRDATLTGTAPTLAAQTAALAAMERVAGVYRIDASDLGVLPLADPYTLSLAVDPMSVTISGSFPDGVTRAALLDDIRTLIGDRPLVDETALARGAPSGFADLASFAIAGLPVLQSGSMSLDGATLSVVGDAATLEGYTAELARLSQPPDGLSLGEIALNPPLVSPYTWSAEVTDSGVTLSGYVPDDEARAAILDAAMSIGTVSDSMETGFGAPDGFTNAATALLAQMQSLDNASASITDRDLSLAGGAADSAAYDAANIFLGSLPEGFDSLSGRIAPPMADPFVTTLSKAPDGYQLSGVVPDETARAVILDALSGSDVEDDATIARGAPQGVAVGDVFATIAATMASLVEGSATLTDSSLVVSGTATDFSSAVEAEATLVALITDSLAVDASIEPGPASPFTFIVDLTENTATLEGFAPDEASRQIIMETASARLAGREVETSVVVAEGAPDGFLAMVETGLRALSRFATGRFELSDASASLSGEVFHESAVEQIATVVSEAAPSGFDLTTDMQTLPPPSIVEGDACQAQFAELLSRSTIRFETGSAGIDASSNGLLDRLVRTLQSCPDASVIIGGHTDAQGDSLPNMRLSQARATAVRDYVVAAGIAPERLTAAGFGESEPIADNDTEDGRAANRRIEFTVQR